MKEGWEYKRLIDICDVYQPKTISTSKLVNNGSYYVYGANGIIGKYINFNHEESEVLLTCRGASCGNINVSKPKSWINGNAMVIHPLNEKITKEYLSYYLKVIDYSKVITGAAQPQITRSSLSDTFILYPSIDEQRRIVSYLDSSFKLIDEIKEKAQKSLSEAKALFQSALAEAMEPKEGWEEKTLGDVGSFKRGGNFTKRDFIEDGFPCVHYGQIHMKFGHITKQHISCVPKELVKKDRCAKKGDLIIAITSEDDEGSCKCTAWMANYEVYVGGHTAIYTHILDPIFMSYFFLSPRFQKEKLEYTHGFKVVEINPKDIAKIPIFYPPLSTQKQIVSHLDKLSSNVKQMEEKYQKMVEECDALKQAMLRDVFE